METVRKNSSKIKVAVVGCGAWGRNLARNFYNLGALATIVENDHALAFAIENQCQIKRQDFAGVLQDPQIHAVVVAVPTVHHYVVAKQVLMAGKHLFIEKPVTMLYEQAEELVNLAQSRNCIFMVGHLPQYHSAFQKLKLLVDQGEIGRLCYVYSNRLNLGRIRTDENCLWDLAPHDISMILGLVNSNVVETYTHGSANFDPVVMDTALVSLTFENGVKGHIYNSWLHPFKEHRLVVVGDKGMLMFDDGNPWDTKLALYHHQIEKTEALKYLTHANSPEFIQLEAEEPLSVECRHFLDCIEKGKMPLTGASEALRVMRLLEAIQPNQTQITTKVAVTN